MATINSLQRVSAASLSKIILNASDVAAAGDPTIAVIDVRDDDYIGGHIKGARNVPSRQLDAMLPTLVRQLRDKDTVVFHCALSQQRGPNAALRYLRERDRILATDSAAAGGASEGSTAGTTVVGVAAADVDGVGAGEGGGDGAAAVAAVAGTASGTGEEGKRKKTQQVLVLDRGFVGWQEEFGKDERLTEGYREELWKDGYWG
ncbi:uncharacterized protein C8A04DRAFT_35304 [Dichotomopilus funicola]|uniref:Rhodanese domain-containing protein n=1 Tax=Dichotomopilus funicola TaxID=1934379 RepID=A0AAN6V743_9PEZI|nr:hypothetical protein C8A04DRAFT_35304 [Dichotomopilus funicola]